MSNHDNGVRPQPATRRRKRAVAVAAGLAALLGAGTYALTTRLADQSEPASLSPAAPVVVSPQPAATEEPTETATSAKPLAAAAGPSASASPSPIDPRTREEIKAAREAAAKEGHGLERALTPAPGAKVAAGPAGERNVPRENGSLRIVTAKHDLTGQGVLLWAGDEGTRASDSTCTQNLRFSNNTKPAVRPNLLLCWRTSAKRSVATVLVDDGGKPSRTESAAIIAREWARLL